MSYILDALIKAERERSVEQVPTLSTVHNTHETPRNRSWIVIAGVMIILAAGLGFLLYMWNSNNRSVAEAPVYAEPQQDTGISERGSASIAASAESASATYLAPQPGSIASNDLPVRKPETERMPSGISPSTKAETGPSRIPDEEIQSASLQNQTILQQDTPLSEEPLATGDARQASGTPSIDNGLPNSSLPPSDIPANTFVLREAMESMNISILQYAENPTDRLVFINGRKYIEGDYIDRLYLIESITRDGAVLRYEGAQAFLKPATN